MNKLLPLMQREWLQHRFAWSLMAAIPLALGLLLTSFGTIDIGEGGPPPEALPVLMALGSIAATTAIICLVAWISSLFIISGLARRDHGDRSVEFWLSLPVGHGQALGVPLLVHLLLVPMVALLIGLAGGYLVSLTLVTHVSGLGAWFSLPWGQLVPASIAVAARLLAGLPMATLWLAPLILGVVLLNAWFRRWGLAIAAVGLGLGGTLLKHLFGQPLLAEWMATVFKNAAMALATGRTGSMMHAGGGEGSPEVALKLVPAWAWHDLQVALGALASPVLLGGLVFAGVCFMLLLQWRQRGAAAAA